MARRPRYSGCIWKRGGVYQIEFILDGIRHRESAKTTSKEAAIQFLNTRIGEARTGDAKIKTTTVKALADLYLNAQKPRWKPETYRWTKIICETHIKPAFGERLASSILPGDLDKLVTQKKEEKLSECRINRLLVIFRAILRYGVKNKALREVPEFPKPFDELPYVRTGHIDEADFFLLSNLIPENEPWLLALVTTAFTFGFRKNELLYMRVNQIDLDRGTITLPPGSTKNKMPRRIVLNPDGRVAKLLKEAIAGKRPDAYVFSRDKQGSIPVRDFRTSLDRVATEAQIKTGSGKNGKLLFHDLRRSAITRMRTAGLTEDESMAIAGHLSVAVHRRYKQVSDWTARQIAAKIDIE